MKKLAILLTRGPYGVINAAEAVRHALGGVGDELEVSLLLTDGGVLLAAKGQQEDGTGFSNLGGALSDCVDMGVYVCVDGESLNRVNLQAEKLIEGVETVASPKISEIMKEADQTMIF